MSSLDIAVIGGGAAGFFGAIKAAEDNARARVTIFEKGANLLTKVRISGGGRCNVTHSCFDPKRLVTHYPRGEEALLGPFHKFQPADTVRWFEDRGVALKTEQDGRLFPSTDTSATIIDALTRAARAANVTVRTNAGLTNVTSDGSSRFHLNLAKGEEVTADRLLLATGSGESGWASARSLGHTIEKPVPSLFTLTISDERLKGLAGLSVENADVSIGGTGLRQSGPLLITHWGLSGPAVLKLSAWGARLLHEKGYRATVTVNWVGLPREAILERFRDFRARQARKLVAANAALPIPRRLWERLVLSASIPVRRAWGDLSNVQIGHLADAFGSGTFEMQGKSTFKDEFVTCGGVNRDEIDFRTMESRRCPGLYFAGEVVDIDGVTGGFNFQNAWTTGWLAGKAMAAEK